MLVTDALDVLDTVAQQAALYRADIDRSRPYAVHLDEARTEAREAVATVVAFLVPDGVRLRSSPLVAPHGQ